MSSDPHQRWRDFIQQFWTIACDNWPPRCINCGCGRSIELEEEADPDDYDLSA